MTDSALQAKFREAFPGRCRDVGEYIAVRFPGAQIYVLKTQFNMLEGALNDNLIPGGRAIVAYLNRIIRPANLEENIFEYRVPAIHADRVIEIIQQNLTQ